MSKRGQQQNGFAAIAAIFLVVVLAGLGGFMVSFSNTAQLGSAQDVQGTRAYWAARAGLEWGLASVTASCPTSPTTLSISGFSVEVRCSSSTPAYSEAGQSINIFQLTSLATSAGAVGSATYVERSVSAGMER